MASEVGSIAVRVGADITELKKGFADASSTVSSFASKAGTQLRGTADSLVKLGAAAAAAGAAVMVALYTDAAKSIDSQAKLAQALGGTIGGLRAAQMAAGDAGVSNEELATTLVKLNQKLGDAERGTGRAFNALQTLGLSARDLSGLDVDQKMIAISSKVKDLGMSSQQAAVLLRDLGIRNENLANLMRNGAEAIQAQVKEVKDLGLNLSMVDAAKVEAANDALGIFGDVFTAIQDKIAVTAAPYLTVLSEKFREAAIESGGFKDLIKTVIDTLIAGFGKAADVIQGLRVVLKGVELIMAGFRGAAISLAEVVATAFTTMYDSAVSNVNFIIQKINEITGSNIANVDTISDSAFMDGLHKMGDEARTQVAVVRTELHSLAMQELPSDKIKKFMSEVEAASNSAAKATVAARASVGGGGVDTGNAEQQKKFKESMDSWNKKNEQELEAIKNRYMTESELIRQHNEEMALIGDEFNAAKFDSEEQWRSIREQSEAEHLARLTEMNRSAYDGMQGLIETRWGKAAASTAGAMKSILGTMATQSRKAFEISKAWAIGDALISTYQGIAKGVSKGFAGIPEVAWAAATGFAQVSAIKNQSYGGAGGAAASGGGTPGTAPNPVGVGGQTSQGQTTTYRVEGMSSGQWLSSDMMVQMLSQMEKDGAFRGKLSFA
jgi:hypothetical protein